MLTETHPVAVGVLGDQRRSLTLWGAALAGVTAMYVSLFPVMPDMDDLLSNMPDALIEGLGYDQIGTAAGYVSSTVYGLLGPVLLLVFGIGLGARLIAGNEENATLELELTSPVPRASVYLQRLEALWINITALVLVVFGVSAVLVAVLRLDIEYGNLVVATIGLWLLVLGFATISFAVGAATGRRVVALGASAGLAVVTWMFDAIAPTIEAGWMSAVSPFSWYLEESPLIHGANVTGLILLAFVPVAAAILGLIRFRSRDLMV